MADSVGIYCRMSNKPFLFPSGIGFTPGSRYLKKTAFLLPQESPDLSGKRPGLSGEGVRQVKNIRLNSQAP